MPYKYEKVSYKTITTVISVHYTVIAIFLYIYDKMYVLRGFDPLLLFFMNEIKIVSYSFSSSVIEYNSNEKL